LLSTTDEFGIPYRRGTVLTPETEDERAQREAAARNLIGRVFKAAVLHLGEDEARRVWQKVAQKKRGARPGSRNAERDRRLLAIHDEVASRGGGQPPASLLRKISEVADTEVPGEYGASAQAVEKQLRRLLARRDLNRRREQLLLAQFLMYDGSSLMSGASSPGLGLLTAIEDTDKKSGS
jgi:hypothetical protein